MIVRVNFCTFTLKKTNPTLEFGAELSKLSWCESMVGTVLLVLVEVLSGAARYESEVHHLDIWQNVF